MKTKTTLEERLIDPSQELLQALKLLIGTFKTGDEDLINVMCDYTAEMAKAFLEAQEGRTNGE